MATITNELQEAITDLQAKHDSLIQAVRDYTGGSISANTNDLLDAQAELMRALKGKESSLLGAMARYHELPTFLLDFENQAYLAGVNRVSNGGAFEDLCTIDRSSKGYGIGSNGEMREFAPNELRIVFDHNGTCQGALIEPVVTNLLSDSKASAWGTSRASVSAFGSYSGLEVARLRPTSDDGSHYMGGGGDAPATAGEPLVFSVIVKKQSFYTLRLRVGNNADYLGDAKFAGDGTLDSYSNSQDHYTEEVGYGYVRVSASYTPRSSGSCSFAIWLYNDEGEVNYVGDPDQYLYIGHLQVEPGRYPTSPVVSDGQPGTRAGDKISVNDPSLFSSRMARVEASVNIVDVKNAAPRIFQQRWRDSDAFIQTIANADNYSTGLYYNRGYLPGQSKGFPSSSEDGRGRHELISAWDEDTLYLSVDGEVSEVPTTSLPVIAGEATMTIGSDSGTSRYMCGTMKYFKLTRL